MADTVRRFEGVAALEELRDIGDGHHAKVVVLAPDGGALTNRSGTITAGGTAQTLAAANASRKYLLIQNPSTGAEACWINFDGTAAIVGQPSIEIAPGAAFVWEGNFVPTGAVSVIAATTGTAFVAKEG